jgi:hypothetical protein
LDTSGKVLQLTYDNAFTGAATSHLTSVGSILSGGLAGGDIGGNITIQLKATGNVGTHSIRGYLSDAATPYLPLTIGGEAAFTITGPTQTHNQFWTNLTP